MWGCSSLFSISNTLSHKIKSIKHMNKNIVQTSENHTHTSEHKIVWFIIIIIVLLLNLPELGNYIRLMPLMMHAR